MHRITAPHVRWFYRRSRSCNPFPRGNTLTRRLNPPTPISFTKNDNLKGRSLAAACGCSLVQRQSPHKLPAMKNKATDRDLSYASAEASTSSSAVSSFSSSSLPFMFLLVISRLGVKMYSRLSRSSFSSRIKQAGPATCGRRQTCSGGYSRYCLIVLYRHHVSVENSGRPGTTLPPRVQDLRLAQ